VARGVGGVEAQNRYGVIAMHVGNRTLTENVQVVRPLVDQSRVRSAILDIMALRKCSFYLLRTC
jgi:hypothetical protein